MFALIRTDQGGGYVARSGSENSYTNELEKARMFSTRDDAEKDRCIEHERVIDVSALLRRGIEA